MYQVTFYFSSDAYEFSPLACIPHEKEMELVTHPGIIAVWPVATL